MPILLSILIATEQLAGNFPDTIFMGEISLDGSLRLINGAFSAAIAAAKTKKNACP